MASKKGVGSSKNGRDSQSKRLDNMLVLAASLLDREELKFILVTT